MRAIPRLKKKKKNFFKKTAKGKEAKKTKRRDGNMGFGTRSQGKEVESIGQVRAMVSDSPKTIGMKSCIGRMPRRSLTC